MFDVLLDQRVEQRARADSLEIEVRAQHALTSEARTLKNPYGSFVVGLDERFQADDGRQTQRPTAQQIEATASKALSATARHRPITDTDAAWLLSVEQTHESCGRVGSDWSVFS
jgi:hypothetical protein